MIYKITPAGPWREAEASGAFAGAPVDLADGFIHFSTAEQAPETAARHFAGQSDLLLVAVEADALGPALRWEPSRGGALFPHLYGPLPLDAVRAVHPLPLGPDGRHRFPRRAGVTGLLARALQPLLRQLDPETAHAAALTALRWAPAAPRPPDDPRLAVEAFGLRFPNPIGVAAGFDKDATVPDALLGLGFGFAEVGTLTPQPQKGNPRPRAFRLTGARAVINRYGFNNEGHAAARTRLLARRARGGLVGVNIGANKDAADRAADYAAGVAAFADLASYIAINVSSPNTPGLRDLQGPAALDDLLARVIEARQAAAARLGRPVPLLLKIAPDLDESGLDAIVRIARDRRLDGMIVSNTTVARPRGLAPERLAREAGGLSGRPLFRAATRVLAQTFLRVEGQFPLVGVGGIEDAATARAKIAAGATLLQVYTALTFEGPGLVGVLKRGLLAGLDRPGATLADTCGRDAGALARAMP